MKIQCSCGAKYELEVIPEMATRPVRFLCSACGLDASEFVNDLIRKELAEVTPPPPPGPAYAAPPPPAAARPAAPMGVLLSASTPPQAAPAPVAGIRVRANTPAAAAPAAAAGVEENGPVCLKHGGEPAVEKCFICAKPICPKCMELFGYLCSPLCKAKAESHGIRVPEYALQRDLIAARAWRKVVRVSLSTGAAIVLLLGVWTWYAWFGRLPKPIFSVRFPAPAFSGSSVICGKEKNQIVFLHGGVLARHDMKQRKQLWSRDLIDHKALADEAAREIKAMEEARSKAIQEYPDSVSMYDRIPSPEKLTKTLERWAAASLHLFVRGDNVWVSTSTNVTRYDWGTGNMVRELAFKSRNYGTMTARGDELLLIERNYEHQVSPPVVTHIDLNTCETRVEDYGGPGLPTNGAPTVASPGGLLVQQGGDTEMAGLPTVPGKDMGKPLDPAKVEEQVRHLPLPARIALPAVLAGTMSQERALTEMDDSSGKRPNRIKRDPGETVSFVPVTNGYIQVGVKLVQQKIVERNAMKAAPTTSVMNGNLTAGNTLEAANEILNEMQRARGGGTVEDDVSVYRVTLRNPGEDSGWTGEVTGPPALFPLQTVNVITANKTVIVLDKSYKKLWEATLSYNVEEYGLNSLDPEDAPYGQGPCVERNGVLYVFDAGVLTAFDLKKGTARWRLPSVGIAGLFFDDANNMYVNTTSANLDSIKYSRQIDLSRRDGVVVLKIDCRNGKILWRAEPGGMVNYVYGKVIFVASMYQPYEDEDEGPLASSGFGTVNPYVRIRRLNPRSGTEMWEHFQQRCPLDIQFDKNIIRLVFKKEVQVLKFPIF